MNSSNILSSLLHTKAGKAWEKIGVYHHHGINIPLSAIHTKKSCGIGEFLDLIPLVTWCHQLKIDVIQLLPINDSGTDPSPYNALSACALHPIYLSLHALPYLDEVPNYKKFLTPLRDLNQTKRVSYHAVLKQKLDYLRIYCNAVGNQLKKEEEYSHFCQKHEWLLEYALFKVFKEKNGGKNWKEWPPLEKDISKNHFKQALKDHAHTVEFYSLLQYLCFTQFLEVKRYAESKNVFLKGDIPILVSPDSADVWAHRHFFDLSQIVGRPGSSLNPEGQYWGFPLYKWKSMEENHYQWWKKRLETAANLYHLYRIDHIIGFFSLWAIPEGKSPLQGKYIPQDPNMMRAQGYHLLEAILSFTDLLPIGEDLGSAYPFITQCLTEYGICGIKIFRWERRWNDDQSFIPYSEYSPISMSSVSTHDLDTTPLWWEKFPEEAKAYATFKGWQYQEKLSGDKQLEILQDNHNSGSLFHINLLQEYLAITPHLTWEDPEEERINYPGTVQVKNWTYRYKMPMEILASDQALGDAFVHILSSHQSLP